MQEALRKYSLEYSLQEIFLRDRSKDALRSIIISQRLLGTREIAVFHHTGCGMLTFSTNDLRGIVKKADPGNAAVASQVDSIDFLEFGHLEDAIKSDVKFLQESPLVLNETKITGWVYEVETGKVCSSLSLVIRLHTDRLLMHRSSRLYNFPTG